ncbi:MAG: TonB-dependent receptor [Candidatus Marinimicrobia bacterium]|jgi:hypothetical protein|nr:TonB-dependent receptor [Candidatus Neomarinimicrobiota bacterium]MBT3501599.1 TonB-dependent receptor [Candidatus Neomarinimicrobiota bacterium]MBT4281697.1 TonB-dependent receptor [Candidatus Neomarinimicrobiota bacterium]MBT4579650.1 TonB-dependent receptor [Candidatus Neomarinimicrobiota bacterium]MBT5461941.1 TonB-dependent receptor [Candidatus Neomarinimicrobiota bacterium]
MVTFVRLTKQFPLYKFLLAGLLYSSPAFSATIPDLIDFNFNQIHLKSALKELINHHGVSIVFTDNISNPIISAECSSCTQLEAIVSILTTSDLDWKQTGNQFTIFNSVSPFRFFTTGRIMDKETGEPVPFANVFIPKLMIGDISRNDGTFSITNISTRVCTLTISYIGYETEKRPLLFPKNESIFQEIFISPKVLSTETVSITGVTREFMDRSNSPGQISFSPRHISTLPNLGEIDIFRALQLLPGIQLGLGGSSGLYIRGGTPDQNLILLDGMPLYHTEHLFGFISGINANAIKDIQVYKGGFPAQYGGRISSVIELTSRYGNTLKPHGSIYGNLMSQGISGELPLFNRGSWIFNLRSSTAINYQTKLHKSIQDFVTGDDNFNLIGESADNPSQKSFYTPRFSYVDMTNHISLIASPNHRITLTQTTGLDSIIEERDFYGFSTLLGYDTTYTKGITEWKSNGMSLNLTSHWNFESNTQIIFSNYTYSSSYDSKNFAEVNKTQMETGTILENNNFHDKSIKFHHRYIGIKNHKIGTGFDETFYKIKFIDIKSDGSTEKNSSQEQNGFLHSFYLQDKWSPNPNWEIQSGLRVSYFSERNGFYSAPRISVVNKLFSNITLETSIGKHYQFLHRLIGNQNTRGTQGMWVLSTNMIPNISSLNTHFGLNIDLKDYSITGEYYYRSMDDLVQFLEAYSPTTSLNHRQDSDNLFLHYGNGKSTGIELLFRKQNGRITGWFSYQRNKTLYTFPGINDGIPFLSDHDKTQEFKSVMMTQIGSWELTANWIYSSGQVYTDSENIYAINHQIVISAEQNKSRIDPIHHLDISVSRSWALPIINIRAGFSIYNLYNRNNISHKRINPYTPEISMTDVSMFGITPTVFFQTSF